MHTFVSLWTTFVSNSDLSGDVEIIDKRSGQTIKIRGESIIEFVADYVRRQRITALENMSDAQILGIPE